MLLRSAPYSTISEQNLTANTIGKINQLVIFWSKMYSGRSKNTTKTKYINIAFKILLRVLVSKIENSFFRSHSCNARNYIYLLDTTPLDDGGTGGGFPVVLGVLNPLKLLPQCFLKLTYKTCAENPVPLHLSVGQVWVT